MENKYFTPTIEDLYIGYECEVKKKGIWTEFIARRDHELNYLYHYMKEVRMDGCQVRTPYLTPEQIEKEGWKPREPIGTEGFITRYGFEKDNYFLLLDLKKDVPVIFVMHRDPSLENTDHFRINCFCPSINEFRKIFKLIDNVTR